MNAKTVIVLGAMVVVSAAMVWAVSAVVTADDEALGLSSTKLSMEVDGTEDLTVWSLPEGSSYTDIAWSSDDETVVTVSGGTVTALKTGTATVTASIGSHRDDCVITVSETVEDTGLTVYNPYSDDFDCAVLTGEGFLGDTDTGGMLALTFNEGGYVAISLAGYSWDWSTFAGKSLGSPMSDFNLITMKVLSGETELAVSEYRFRGPSAHVFTTSEGLTYNSSSANPAMYVKGLADGTYTAEFSLYRNTSDTGPQATVSGTFELRQGDGRYDTSSEYTRSYAWMVAVDDTAGAKKVSLSMTYSYADYWNSVMLSKQKNIYYNNGVQNHSSVGQMPGFCVRDGSVTGLEQSLKNLFLEKYPSLTADGQEYAQFLLTFVQICYFYENDYAQNGDCDAYMSGTDVWAYPSMTLYSGMGDCEDTSLLLDALYRQAGFDAALIVPSGHAMAAVVLESFDDYGTDGDFAFAQEQGDRYYFCETTSVSPVLYIDTVSQPGKRIYTYTASFKDKTTIESFDHEYRLVGCVTEDVLYADFTFLTVE